MSAPTVPQAIDADQANKEVPLREDISASCHQTVYGYRYETSSGLTFGYHAGRWGGFSVAAGTVTLTGSTTNYIVVNRSTGAVSVSTATTNWNDSTAYARVYRVTTNGSGVTNLYGSDFDYRAGPGGVHGYVSAGAVDADDVTYTPTTLADWDSSADPGDVEQALDQLAERVADLEVGGAGDEHYEVDGTPASDDTWGGRGITGVNAGATIAQWEAVYLASDGEWALADANGTGTYPCRGLAAAAGTDGNPMTVVTEGVIRNDAWNWTTLGAPIYLSGTPGALTQTAPSTTGDKVQPVGFAITADVMYLCIGAATYVEVA